MSFFSSFLQSRTFEHDSGVGWTLEQVSSVEAILVLCVVLFSPGASALRLTLPRNIHALLFLGIQCYGGRRLTYKYF